MSVHRYVHMLRLIPFCPWGIIGNPLIDAANVGQTLERPEVVQLIFYWTSFVLTLGTILSWL